MTESTLFSLAKLYWSRFVVTFIRFFQLLTMYENLVWDVKVMKWNSHESQEFYTAFVGAFENAVRLFSNCTQKVGILFVSENKCFSKEGITAES